MAWIRLNPATVVESGAIIAAIYVVATSIRNQSFLFSTQGAHGLLSASLVALCVTYFTISHSLKGRATWVERIAISMASLMSSIFIYEALYSVGFLNISQYIGFWGVPYWSDILKQSGINGVITATAGYLMLFMFQFTGIRYMRMSKWFLIDLAASLTVFSIWIIIGYPQYFETDGATQLAAFIINSASKFPVYLLPATLYIGD